MILETEARSGNLGYQAETREQDRWTMSDELRALVEKFRHYRMTPQELTAQAISFAYGNGHIEEERVTREGITLVAARFGDIRPNVPPRQ